ncbi:hypothetical protein A2U01_0112346 [Trifolium medium]|uniref:Uncharacterized protein n=1 Tax=Trifolium medium TaxID=97028 RepID=A0A392VUC6_9FABA|nr:hypothetical protein [Trifolium medium]
MASELKSSNGYEVVFGGEVEFAEELKFTFRGGKGDDVHRASLLNMKSK